MSTTVSPAGVFRILTGFSSSILRTGGPGGGDEVVLAVARDLHRRPLPIVEAGRRPAGLLETRVVGLAVVDLRHQDRARGRLPALVRPDDLLAPVLVGDLDLQQQRQPVAVDVAPIDAPGQVPAVPAVAELDPDGVVARLQEGRDVVRLVLQALVVARPPGREELVAHPAAVQVHLVEAVARHVGPRPRDGAVQLELPAQHRHRTRLRHVLRQARLDPARLPVRGLEKPHLPPRGRAPGRGLPAPVPHPHLPVVPPARLAAPGRRRGGGSTRPTRPSPTPRPDRPSPRRPRSLRATRIS